MLLGPQEQEQDEEIALDGDPFSRMTKPDHANPITNGHRALPLRYHINGMFVRPEARRLGVAGKLMDALLAEVKADAPRVSRTWISTVFVDEMNKRASRLYLKLGFAIKTQKVDSKRVVVDGQWSEEDRTLLEMSLMNATESHT